MEGVKREEQDASERRQPSCHVRKTAFQPLLDGKGGRQMKGRERPDRLQRKKMSLSLDTNFNSRHDRTTKDKLTVLTAGVHVSPYCTDQFFD